MISIIIPVYNQAEHLNNCLANIKKQTYKNYEIIVVNDGSSDNLAEIIKKYKNIFGFRLNYLEENNKGANAARNYGARIAKGEYLIFCDADIIMAPNMLELMLQALKENPLAGFCYSSFKRGGKIFKLWPFDRERLKIMPYINIASLIKREYFPGFDENLKKFQDWDLWLTITEQGHDGVWLGQILHTVNVGGTQTMSRWLPSWAYTLLPFLPTVKKYQQAKQIIQKKHNLS